VLQPRRGCGLRGGVVLLISTILVVAFLFCLMGIRGTGVWLVLKREGEKESNKGFCY